MPPSAPDIARLRGGYHALHPALNSVPLIQVATAQVNQASFSYPLGELTVDNWTGIAGVKVGQLVHIGTTPGGADVTVGIARKLPSASKLYIDGKSLGDPGWPREIINPLQDNLYITVYKFRPAWGLLSSIRNGIFYKGFDLPYSGEGVNPYPVPVLGTWRQAFAGTGTGSADLAFSAADSFAWGGASIVAYSWYLDGGDAVSGSLTGPNVTGRFPPGFYELQCTVTDSIGRTRTGYRYVWINSTDPDSPYAPFNWKYATAIRGDKQDIAGREMQLTISGNFDAADVPYPGQGWHLNEYPTFGGETLDNPAMLVQDFAGYASERALTTAWNRRESTITVQSPLKLARGVPTASQEMLEAVTPNNWAEISPKLSNPVGAYWYITTLHSPYLIDAHDLTFDPSLLLLRRQIFTFMQPDAFSQINTLAEMFNGVIGEKANGTIRMVRNPNYLQNDDRPADSAWTWTPPDIVGAFSKSRRFRMSYGHVHGYAYSFDGGAESTPYESLAPGMGKAQAPGVKSMTGFIVTHTDGQTARPNRVDEITGHEFAVSNSPIPPFQLTAAGNMDIAEPVDVDVWHTLNVPASYDPAAAGWLNKRLLPTRVNRNWKEELGAQKSVQIEFEVETFGQPGTPIPVNRGGANNPDFAEWNPGLTEVYQPTFPETSITAPILLAWNDAGQLGRTKQFTQRLVYWFSMNTLPGAFSGSVLDVSLVYQSAYFSDPTQPLKAWILTNDNGTLKAWLCDDIFAELPTYTNPVTGQWTPVGDFRNKARIIASREELDFIFVGWKSRAGVQYARSTDGGTTFSAQAYAGVQLVVTDTEHDLDEFGVAVYDELQVVCAPDGTTGTDGKYNYFPYKATSKVGAFTAVASVPADFRQILGFVGSTGATQAYVSMEKLGTPAPPAPLGIVTFDPGGYESYIVNGAGVTASGNPGNCAWNAVNNPLDGDSVGVGVTVDLGGDYILSALKFDRRFQFGNTTNDYQVTTHIICMDAEDNVLIDLIATSAVNSSSLADSISAQSWLTIEANAQKLSLSEPVRKVQVTASCKLGDVVGAGIWYAFIDNIDITGILITEDSARKLYSINPGAGIWTDVTPARPHVPKTPYGLSYDYPGATSFGMIAYDANGYAYLYGDPAFSRIARSAHRGVKLAGTGLIGFGFNSLALSLDREIFYTRLGNWVNAIGEVGEIRGVTGVL